MTDGPLTPLLDTIDAPAAMRSLTREQLKQLADWVALVAQSDTSKRPAKFALEVAAAPIAPATPFGFAADVAPSAFLDPSVVQAGGEESQQPTAKKDKVKFGADLRPWQPKDEFDPEAFNRLERQTTATGAATALGPPVSQ